MNNKIRTLVCILAVAVPFSFQSCKKNSAPSVVGKWTLSNYAGTTTSNTSNTNGSTTTYSYTPGTSTLTQTTTVIGSSTANVVTTQVGKEEWDFNSDGTYTISEVYTQGTSSQITSTATGVWDYFSNTASDKQLYLNGNGSNIINSTSIFTIKSIGSQLILTDIRTYTDNLGTTYSNNLTVTFTKS